KPVNAFRVSNLYYNQSLRKMVTYYRFLNWDGIGRRDMGDRIGKPVRIDRYLPYHEAFANLHQSGFTDQVRGARLAQEIDIEISGDRERLRPDRGKDGDIHCEIGKLHHRRAGNGAAR